jgi:hypothetical protein
VITFDQAQVEPQPRHTVIAWTVRTERGVRFLMRHVATVG